MMAAAVGYLYDDNLLPEDNKNKMYQFKLKSSNPNVVPSEG